MSYRIVSCSWRSQLAHFVGCGLFAVLLTAGCAGVKPPGVPTTVIQDKYPPLPQVITVSAPPVAANAFAAVDAPKEEFPCGHSLTVKVGKLEVEMPKGGSLEVQGIKAATNAYHIVLEGVEFSHTDHCMR